MDNEYCLNCGQKLKMSANAETGRKKQFCKGSCRVAYHRKQKRYNEIKKSVTKVPDLSGVLILELFPGAGLFGRAFKALGACVVNAGDIMQGHDIRAFKGIRARFDGVIGGPPCQFASKAAITGTKAVNMIPEFLRVVEECSPTWAVMENVREARPFAPQRWDYVFLRDWDCGGETHRRRGFWFYGTSAPMPAPKRDGKPAYSVLASSWNPKGKTSLGKNPLLTPEEAARLQGYPGLEEIIINHQPGWARQDGSFNGVSKTSREVIATHMMGNGVPFAMGKYVAEWIAISVYGAKSATIETQLPLFA